MVSAGGRQDSKTAIKDPSIKFIYLTYELIFTRSIDKEFGNFKKNLFSLLLNYGTTDKKSAPSLYEKKSEDPFTEGKYFIDIGISLKINQLTNRKITLYFNRSEDQNFIKITGLPPDMAWRLRYFIDSWRTSNPKLFEDSEIKLSNMSFQVNHPVNSMIYELFLPFFNVNLSRIFTPNLVFIDSKTQTFDKLDISFSVIKQVISIHIDSSLNLFQDIHFSNPSISLINQTSLDDLVDETLISDIFVCELISNKISEYLTSQMTVFVSNMDKFVKQNEIKFPDNDLGMNNFNELYEIFISQFQQLKLELLLTEEDFIEQIELKYNLFLGGHSNDKWIPDIVKLNSLQEHIHGEFHPLLLLNTETVFESNENRINPHGLSIFHIFNNFDNLIIKKLDLSDFSLLSNQAFTTIKDLDEVIYLNLNNNKLLNFNDNSIFRELADNQTSLESLSLRSCWIDKLDMQIFEGLKNLNQIDLRSNLLSYIEFSNSDHIPIRLFVDPDVFHRLSKTYSETSSIDDETITIMDKYIISTGADYQLKNQERINQDYRIFIEYQLTGDEVI